MDPAAATGQVRVAIVGDGAAADLALPTKLALRELIPRIRATLATGRDDDEIPADRNGAAIRPYSLKPIGGTPFSLDATLETLGVDDGNQLMLCMLPPGPAAPPVVEDIADAAAIHSAQQFKVFEHTMLGPAAQAAVLAAAALISGLAVYGWHRGYTVWATSALAGVTVVFITAAMLARRQGLAEASGRMGAATTILLALALLAALPGDSAAPRVFLAAAGVVAWSLLLSVVTNSWVAAHTAVIAVGGAVVLASAARILWHLPYLALGCGVLAVSLLLATRAPTAAAIWARFPLPNVPAPGEPVPPPLSLTELEDLPRRAALTQAFQAGFIAASVILAVVGSVLVVWLPAEPSLLCWWLVVVTAIVTVLRMRLFDAAAPSLWFIASPLLTAAAVALSFTATGHLIAAVWAVGALIGLTVVLVAAAAIRPKALSIPHRGYLDLLENALLYTIPPVMLWLVGLVSLIRNRGAL
jgi:type VII secretion integral membrane protein EccD